MEDKYARHTYSYLNLRSAVGWIGLLLPFVLVLGTLVVGGTLGIERSVSYYYHTIMRDVFVGALSAVALFLLFYCGYGKLDDWAGNIAGLFLVGVAWLPTTQNGPAEIVGTIHLVCAGGFFITVSLFSLLLFTRTDKPGNMGRRKEIRNGIYITCGVIMLLSLAAILVYKLVDGNEVSCFVFIAETVALVAFGISWITKAETLYPDSVEASGPVG